MYKVVVILSLITVLFSCKSKGKGSNVSEESDKDLLDTTYTITGYLEGTPQGTKVILTYLGIDRKPDTAVFKGDNFTFKGKTTEPLVGQIYYLDASNNPQTPLKLMVENAVINIEGHKDSIEKSKVIGGLENTDYGSLKKILQLYWDSINVLALRAQEVSALHDTAQMKKVQVEYTEMEKETRAALKQYAIEHPTSVASAYYVMQYYTPNSDINQLDSIYSSYDSSVRTSLYVKKIKETLDIAKRTSIGQPAPDLVLNDPSGNPVTLSSYKGKWVLLDFWASWCVPCRQENPNLVRTYNTYKRKGFEILSISLDSSRQAWTNAIKKDKLSWKQVSDLKGLKSTAASLYGINSIPASFLIDKEGKIIAKNLHGELLTTKLNEIIK